MNSIPFSSLSISDDLLAVVHEMGFEHLTQIQAKSIPILLQGRDVVGQSKTGSGKTVSFALPILQNINLNNRTCQALILCPTRELSVQVGREFRKLGRRLSGFQVAILCGGQTIGPQLSSLEGGVHVAVGTPGRVLDIMDRVSGNRGKRTLRGRPFDFQGVRTLVLDEADRMLDMGFEEELQSIIESLPLQRQTVFFSATFPKAILDLSKHYQNDPVKIAIDDSETSDQPIKQWVYRIGTLEKVDALKKILLMYSARSILIFCNQKVTVDEVVKAIKLEGKSCAGIHGNLEQWQRDRVMAMFRNETYRILVATDVAARGIDIDHLDLVINFDLPHDPETYVHRMGRTGRAGRTGMAVSIAKAFDELKIKEIENVTGIKLLEDAIEKPGNESGVNIGTETDTGIETDRQPSLNQEANIGRTSVKKPTDLRHYRTITIHAGRKDKVRPGDVLGALTGEAGGLSSAEVGKIEILDRISYVAVDSKKAEDVVQRLLNGKIKGRRFHVTIESN